MEPSSRFSSDFRASVCRFSERLQGIRLPLLEGFHRTLERLEGIRLPLLGRLQGIRLPCFRGLDFLSESP